MPHSYIVSLLLPTRAVCLFFCGEGPRSRSYGRTAALKAYCATQWGRWWERWLVLFIFPSNGAPVEWNWQGKTEVLGERPVPVPLCPPQMPHGLTWDRTRASAVGGRRLTARAMARAYRVLLFSNKFCWWLVKQVVLWLSPIYGRWDNYLPQHCVFCCKQLLTLIWVSVWLCLIDDQLTGIVVERRLTLRRQLTAFFLRPGWTRGCSATAFHLIAADKHLNRCYGKCCIRLGVPHTWPSRLPGSTPLYFDL
jgi:hypothetical protein